MATMGFPENLQLTQGQRDLQSLSMLDKLKQWYDQTPFLDKQSEGPNGSILTNQGLASPMINGMGALGNFWMANQQLKLARNNNKFQKNAINRDIQNQGTIINSDILRRQKEAMKYNGNTNEGIKKTLNDDWKRANLVNTSKI
jgi:hypothetical protein